MSVNKYRLWFKENKYSSQDLRKVKYTALAVCKLFQVKGFKEMKRFRDFCKELAFKSFLSIRPFLLDLVIVLIKEYIYVLLF